MNLNAVTAHAENILDEVERAVVGKRGALELTLAGLLANGHVLLEDVPGLGKTLIAWSFAQVTGLDFARVQFTPDLMPTDIVGSAVFDQRSTDFVFRPGPVFNNLILADEINRASPKTQAALLEAMQERQVSMDGVTHPLQRPFLVMATQNPVEYEGTYPLPEAQLDRFLLRVSVGYPDRDDEAEVLSRRLERRQDAIALRPVVDRATFVAMQDAVESVHVDESLRYYMVDLVTATRAHESVQVGASPRGSLALVMASRARAVLEGRDYVTPHDVKRVAVAALGHRLVLKPAQWVRGVSGDDIVRHVLGTVPTPTHRGHPVRG